MSNLSVENVYTRQEAKELCKKHFWKLLGMFAITFGAIYAITLGGTALLALAANEAISMVGSIVLMVVMTLVGSGLMLGLLAAMIDLCRGDETITVGRVFSRMGQCLKAFGLSLWIELKIFLWILPSYLLFGFVSFGILTVGDPQNAQPTEATTVVLAILPVLFMILIFALVIPAAFRYMLSTYILADKPETGVFECVKQSKAMMKGHKWQAFKLIVPIVLVMNVLMMVMSFVFGFVAGISNNAAAATIMSIVTLVVFLALVLYFGIRMYLCYVLFYLKRVNEQNPAVEAAVEPAQEPAQAE